jgi:hypothetical protein
MEYTITTAAREFKVKSKFMRTVDKFPNTINDKYDGQHNQFLITVKHNGIVRRFSFYGSTADYNAGIKELTEADTKDAFKCFIEDAISGDMTFDDFCDNMGYDTDSRIAERIWELCKKALVKAHDLRLNYDDLCEIANDLNERS